AFQVRVPAPVVGIHAVGVDGQRDARLARIVLVDGEFALHLVESAVDVADAEMLDLETHRRMHRIDRVRIGSLKRCDDGDGDNRSGEADEETMAHAKSPCEKMWALHGNQLPMDEEIVWPDWS